jgi:hypothetical protein
LLPFSAKRLSRIQPGAIVRKMEIREAVAGDAEEACNVMRRSITELCAADHGNDRRCWRSG